MSQPSVLDLAIKCSFCERTDCHHIQCPLCGTLLLAGNAAPKYHYCPKCHFDTYPATLGDVDKFIKEFESFKLESD
jgi:hypothetical protein